jgi:hypothetical protein
MSTPLSPPATPDAAEAYMDAAAPMLGLRIPPECREGVIANLQRTAAIAALVLAHPLAPDDEPAAVFRP